MTATIESVFTAPDIVRALTPGARLPIGLYRMEGRDPRFYLAWSPPRTPKPNFHVPDAFGVLALDAVGVEMVRAGAVGFVAKESAFEDLTEAIRTVMDKRMFFGTPALFNIANIEAVIEGVIAQHPDEFK